MKKLIKTITTAWVILSKQILLHISVLKANFFAKVAKQIIMQVSPNLQLKFYWFLKERASIPTLNLKRDLARVMHNDALKSISHT